MTDKISVVYIGHKKQKRDTVTGSRIIFPRLEPVSVSSSVAYQLLNFPSVFVRESDLQATLDREQEAERIRQEEEEQQKLELVRQQEASSFVVTVNGEKTDISKFTSVQLITLCEAEELLLKKEQGEKVENFRLRVRDALKSREADTDGGTE
ncbi:TPA: hypothetical protein N3G98_004471 [Salmonella enterica subsp. enterica serovar Denver]|nr:hypothetical protein [Salmonella enterica subsp. enterica serovar Denver]ECD5428177.1 hypothetical protein [Salmonella enterica subsp. enterica serovar Denver]HCM3794286.1 hypothetical protein [Salmonella enterica subsp. enterica serovar Denver]